MNVLLVSQCSKNALTETRRVLDQFAERRGERTWQTPITQAGLETLYRLLRKTARKNTAVACHWIRGKDHSELMWIVGDARQFNELGATPTNMTRRNVLRSESENDWHSLTLIHLLTSLAALLHDLGKACLAFQQRLTAKGPVERNLYRHEWVSLRLFQAFVGDSSDAEWLERLIAPSADDDHSWTTRVLRDGLDAAAQNNKPFAVLPPLAKVVAWLVLTHHRLPVMPTRDNSGKWKWLGARVADLNAAQLDSLLEKVDANWNELADGANKDATQAYWKFPHGLPVTTDAWRKRASRVASRLLAIGQSADVRDCLDDPYVMHLGRLSLMLADHHYSSLTDLAARSDLNPGYPLFANTDRKTGTFNQTLDEHLLGVARHAGMVAHALPGFEHHLPRLVRHKGLRRRSADARFRWQDRAADLAEAMRESAFRHGAFIVNMASTGCGKTLANARIMNAMADPSHGMRCAFALGLRALTLQTGRAFRDELQLSDEALAIRVGGAANRELFEHYEQLAEQSGSASSQSLLPEDAGVVYEGNTAHPLLQRLSHDPRIQALLAAPLLVCTIDHLTPATESQRGGGQIAPMLRLMSGDLVLDEPDDFDIDDLPALARLVHWAGLLGSRVLLSSATLPPALVQGLFEAYLDGRRWFQRNRGERPGAMPEVCCIWVDEFDQTHHTCTDSNIFAAQQLDFARRRHARLAKEAARRRAELLQLPLASKPREALRPTLAATMREAALSLHATHHSIDPQSGKRVSFGLVRMANIDPLIDVALALYTLGAPDNIRIHLCTYHSQYPLLIRSAIEHRMDAALNRRTPDAVFALPEIRSRLDTNPEADHLFIVLGSPVTEVGRDHDYDWAVVEPSSMRSLIQLAGRVRRHRPGTVDTPNILVLETNLRHFEHRGEPAYCKPGFETTEPRFKLQSHWLTDLLEAEQRDVIDARPRILPKPDEALQPAARLVDLEHARIQFQMRPQTGDAELSDYQRRKGARPAPPINATTHWLRSGVSLTAVLPQQQPFRHDPLPKVDVILLPNDDDEDYALFRVAPGQDRYRKLYVKIEDSMNCRIDDEQLTGTRITPWGVTDYMTELVTLAEERDMTLETCAERYGTVTLPTHPQGWRFHPALGFTRNR
ncbi:type I-F CRISPR-associated helicase Cas3 [Parazoarcus communis]|uniref:Type I-F CRISPR-associated helicase Cas3 n=1 Tax=Parazoarcus communis TaxID=41977 RepID=A0A2U8H5C6_9RHOO|nr:type I-F CRISPR-associated helicase Cas3f [Parazoarcus communis]AWI81279.1 type I-F CRISPR-associated helicase Cas3 [Parazoarcus communis]